MPTRALVKQGRLQLELRLSRRACLVYIAGCLARRRVGVMLPKSNLRSRKVLPYGVKGGRKRCLSAGQVLSKEENS
ncbi:unnamed protein product [Boreogadus saida]